MSTMVTTFSLTIPSFDSAAIFAIITVTLLLLLSVKELSLPFSTPDGRVLSRALNASLLPLLMTFALLAGNHFLRVID
jgi:hypothetical protein